MPMPPNPNVSKKSVVAKLDVLLFPIPPDRPDGAACLNCDALLSLSQPDIDTPERLIGVCDQCKHWFLIDLLPDEGEGIISGLPDLQVIRNLSSQGPEHEISVQSPVPEEVSVRQGGSSAPA